MPATISDIPPAKVGQVVQDFINYASVRQLTVDQQPDGNFTVTPVA